MLSLPTVALALALLTNAQVPSSAPQCVRTCATAKVSEGFCGTSAFQNAYNTCLSDNCGASDVQAGQTLNEATICAGASSVPGSATSPLASSTTATGTNSVGTSTSSAPSPSPTGNATAYAAGAVAALNSAGLTGLAGLIQASPPSMIAALSQGQHTLFAPSNEALAAISSNVSSNSAALAATLQYHILAGRVDPSALSAGNTTLVRSSLRGLPYVNLPGNQSQVVVLTPSNGTGITVVEPNRNITSSGNATYENLSVQVVPAALSVPGTLGETLGQVGELSSLVAAVQSVSPSLVSTLGNITGLTVFAPINSAFSAAQPQLAGANTTMVQDALLNHIVNGTAVYSSLLATGNQTSAGGETLSFTTNSTGSFVSSGGSTARIVQPDIIVQNGVVHLIDGVLLNMASNPSAAASAAASAASAQATQTAVQTGAVTPSSAAGAGSGGSSGNSGGAVNSGAGMTSADAITATTAAIMVGLAFLFS